MKKFVWLNMNTGEFSCSWKGNISDIDFLEEEDYKMWKLIKYKCVNDPDFEFYDLMKITTNLKGVEK